LERATHTIVQQVEAMKEMVNAFSDYARPPQMNPEPVALDALVSEVLDLYRSAGLKPKLAVRLTAGNASVEVDPVRIRQVIHNLVKNAQEAVQEQVEPWVEVSTRRLSKGGAPFVEIEISDNGPGFDDETLAHLFEPYVTTKLKGTGLGLAIVKKIVEEHGGLIWAENRAQQGARVIFRLPALGATLEREPDSLRLSESDSGRRRA
jgi:nitrogen fixation/metabolism regulation signal transduction histidine kinase